MLPSSKDIAVRVTSVANLAELEAQIAFIFGSDAAKFRRAVPGQRWWRFGPLRDAELWAVKDLIAQTGLVPLRDELRTARAGPFRSYVYFAAAGSPSRTSLDDGSWSCSQAALQPAEPPPRRKPPGPALSPQSTWGGPRPAAAAAPGGAPGRARPTSSPSPFPAPAQLVPSAGWAAASPCPLQPLGLSPLYPPQVVALHSLARAVFVALGVAVAASLWVPLVGVANLRWSPKCQCYCSRWLPSPKKFGTFEKKMLTYAGNWIWLGGFNNTNPLL